MIVDCAVYEDGLAPARGELPIENACEPCDADRGFVWIGLHEPTEDEFDVGAARVRPARAGGRGRDQGAPAPEARGLRRLLFMVLKTARYSTPTRPSSSARSRSSSARLRGHGAPRRGRRSTRSRLRHREAPGPAPLRARGAALYAIVDRVVDDYVPVIAGLDQRHRARSRTRCSRRRAANPAERIYKLKREVLELHDAVAPLLEPLERAGARPPRADPRRDARRTSATSTTT